MSETSESSMKLHTIMGKNGLILAGFAAFCVGMVTATYFLTRDKIASETEEALARTLNQIIPHEQYDNNVNQDCIRIDSDGIGRVYRMRNSDKPVALVLETTAPNGYSGAIKLMVGVYTDGSIAAARVTEHKETPGLGDKIDVSKSDWILGFNDLSLKAVPKSDWTVKKDGGHFDSFTGATITPRAVSQRLAETLEYVQANQTQLYSKPANCKAVTDNGATDE